MSSITTRRSLIYWGLIVLFLLGGGPIFNLNIMVSPFVHTVLDSLAVGVLVVAILLVYRAYLKNNSTALAIMVVTLLGTAAFELLHQASSIGVLNQWMVSEPENFMPWSWHASRIFLAIGLLTVAWHSGRENYGPPETVGQKKFPSPLLFGLFTLVAVTGGTVALIMSDLRSIYYSSMGLIRMPEVVSGSIFLVALLVFLRKGNWRTDSYGHWLVIVTVASFNVQFFCMAFSQQLFDSSFTAAHILKVFSFACLVFGFLHPHKASSAEQEASEYKPKGISLGIKVALLCGLIAFICVMPIAIKSSANLHEIAAASGIDKLSAAATNSNNVLEDQRRRINDDLNFLASADTIDALHRANQSADGIDIVTGKTPQQLISDLQRLVGNLLFSDADYLRITYVDAVSGITVVSSEQRTADAGPDMQALADSESELAGRIFSGEAAPAFLRSDIFLVNDSGSSDGRALRVESAALPVWSSEEKSVLGIFIAHSNVSNALKAMTLPNVETSMYVVNQRGEFLQHPDAGKEINLGTAAAGYTVADEFPGLDFAGILQNDAADLVPASGRIYDLADGTEVLLGFNQLSSAVGTGESLRFIYTGERDVMEAQAVQIGYDLQQIAQFNLLVAILIGWFFARRFAKPVQQISAAAVDFGRNGTVTELPIRGRDEIGLLGKSLSDMMSEVSGQREKLALLAAAVESSVESTIITSIDGNIKYVNPRYEEYAGVNAADVLGKNVMELPEFKENRNILSKSPSKKGGETIWTGSMTTRRADGRLHDEAVTIAPIRDADGKNSNQSLIIEDITERRAMEKYIEGKTAELQRSNRDLEQFAYVASHDLKAPLRAIEVLVSWLKDDLEEYQEGDVQENLDLLRVRTARLSRLLDDLLAYSRAGRKIGDVKEVDCKVFVQDIAQLISPPEGFTIEVDASLPTLTTYHAPLETVFRNLMSNAVKHSPQPELGRIRVFAEDRGDQIEFAVEDNGTGIAPEYAEKVFKMFQTLQARDEKEGSGMGLAIVQRIIDWQGGRIWFHDGPDGKGTVFRFTWSKKPPQMPELPDGEGDAASLSETQILRAQASEEAKAEREAEYGEGHAEAAAVASSAVNEAASKPEPADA